MQASARRNNNLCLDFALLESGRRGRDLVTIFVTSPHVPNAHASHYRFLLEGIQETRARFEADRLEFVVLVSEYTNPAQRVFELVDQVQASLIVLDTGYLDWQKQWRTVLIETLASKQSGCDCVQIEADSMVAAKLAYPKQAWSAAVFRPAIMKHFPVAMETDSVKTDSLATVYTVPRHQSQAQTKASAKVWRSLDQWQLVEQRYLGQVSGAKSLLLHGGAQAAQSALDRFLQFKLEYYHLKHNDPALDASSQLSAWIHFGHVAVSDILAQVLDFLNQEGIVFDYRPHQEAKYFRALEILNPYHQRLTLAASAFFEQLVVRRELAINYVNYNPHYKSFEGISPWAKASLLSHGADPRPYTYSLKQLEQAQTHDRWWNAAQKQLLDHASMHGYMRMYWGKKIIEWSSSPREAYDIAVYLNDRYQLDGRDANGYTGIAWCFGVHDRPWSSRPIFGTVRYMNDKGLERKFDMQTYASKQLD